MKKTITIDFTFKRWMKLALLAIAFLLMSYLFMTGAHAQSNITALSTSGTVLTTTNNGILTVCPYTMCTASGVPKSADPSFSQVWFATVSGLFLLGAFFTTLAAIATWNTSKEE